MDDFEIDVIYNEDHIDTMKRFPNDVIDLVITSPPYDKNRIYDGYEFNFELCTKETI